MLRHPPSSRCPPFADRTPDGTGGRASVAGRPRRRRCSMVAHATRRARRRRGPVFRESGERSPRTAAARRPRAARIRGDAAQHGGAAVWGRGEAGPCVLDRAGCRSSDVPNASRSGSHTASTRPSRTRGRVCVPRTVRAGGGSAASGRPRWPARESIRAPVGCGARARERTRPKPGTRKGPGRSRGPSWRHVLLDAPS